MSAELYDAEIAGALARPAVDVLPVHPSRKDKTGDILPGVPQIPVDEVPAPAAEAAPEPTDVPAEPVEAIAPGLEAEPTAEPAADEAAPRKVFGLQLSRGRRAKPGPAADEPVDEVIPSLDEAPVVEVPGLLPAAEVAAEQPAWDFALGEEVATPDAAPLAAAAAPAVEAPVDHESEARALRALLESSEELRQQAEARTTAAEAASRTAANAVQEWQIRHREAESTITELAASLAGAEGRMAELHQQLQALQSERDELVSQLDAATSPTA